MRIEYKVLLVLSTQYLVHFRNGIKKEPWLYFRELNLGWIDKIDLYTYIADLFSPSSSSTFNIRWYEILPNFRSW